jgi:cobalt-zinc-cadmium efflux system protein
MDMASAHLVVADDSHLHGVLDRSRQMLRERWNIAHVTLQVEPADHLGCDDVDW